MELNEKHHALIVLGFYRELVSRGKRGYDAFVKGAQLYGESRGRRMALRALRDGNPLDFVSYFAYSEWEASENAFDCSFTACSGYVDENVTRCPWAALFSEEDAKECGVAYCNEIDRAIVRGFNPALTLDVPHTQHLSGSCQFYFRDAAVTDELFKQVDVLLAQPHGEIVKEFAFHCADVWYTYCNVCFSVFGESEGRAIIDQVRQYLVQKTSNAVLETIENYRSTDFNRVS